MSAFPLQLQRTSKIPCSNSENRLSGHFLISVFQILETKPKAAFFPASFKTEETGFLRRTTE